ncbi:MAG: alpha/beta fold hydrolase [Chloroflexi bacterium]|nr:alpha/beta fold hydrolase [Chloroflexota bacterium]
MSESTATQARREAVEPIVGREHWVTKQHESGQIRIWAWEKLLPSREGRFAGTVLLVHGSSMASTPTLDLHVPGRGEAYSMMDYFARLGYDVWCFDCEGYGRSDKSRDSKFYVADGADDTAAVAEAIRLVRGDQPLLVYGISSGALRAAMFAERNPGRVKRLVLDAFVWTGEGSPTLEQRRKRLPELLATNRRPVNPEFVKTIFTRDHPGTAEEDVVDAFAAAIVELDDSVPNGTYIDMCQNLPLVDPRNITCSVMIARGQFDGIAGFDDLLEFFRLLPNADKHFAVMPGSAHSSIHEKNYRTLLHIIASYWCQPDPVYLG